MLTEFTVVSFHNICESSDYAVHFKLIYVNYISINLEKLYKLKLEDNKLWEATVS